MSWIAIAMLAIAAFIGPLLLAVFLEDRNDWLMGIITLLLGGAFGLLLLVLGLMIFSVAYGPDDPLRPSAARCVHRLPAEFPACEGRIENLFYQLRLRADGRKVTVWDGTRQQLLGRGALPQERPHQE